MEDRAPEKGEPPAEEKPAPWHDAPGTGKQATPAPSQDEPETGKEEKPAPWHD